MAEETTAPQPGMVLAVEIGAFDPDGEVFDAMPEDVILITDRGPEILTAHGRLPCRLPNAARSEPVTKRALASFTSR